VRRVDQLITLVRRQTENVDYGSTYGIAQDDFAQYMSDAQDMLQGAIMRACPSCTWFYKQSTASLVSGTRAYAMPTDCYYKNQLASVEFTESTSDYYQPLTRVPLVSLEAYSTWPPNAYAVVNNEIWLSPPPNASTGTLRYTYLRKLPRLDLPRGTITSLISTAMLLNNDSLLDATNIGAWVPGIFSITHETAQVPISLSMTCSGYNSGTRTLTVSAGPTYETGYSASDLADAIITLGKHTTCNSQLPDECERYLVAYCAWKTFRRESSSDATSAGSELSAIEADIIASINSSDTDPKIIVMESTLV
jgi:hypothetical protein